MNPPKDWLVQEFSIRKQRNKSFTLRAFARTLKISSGRLSEIFNGKRNLTEKMAARFATTLGVNPDLFRLPAQSSYQQMSVDTFESISDSLHIALLSLVETSDFKNDLSWMAGRLQAQNFEVEAALSRLERLGLLKKENDTWKPTLINLRTTQDLKSAALRRSHRQSLEQAIDALESVRLELRDITSITMAIDVSKIPAAKEKIRRFREDLATLMEAGNQRTEVYNLNVQLVPVTKIQESV